MINDVKVGFVCFGEVNTPYEQIKIMGQNALKDLKTTGFDIADAGIVVDDPEYSTANKAVEMLNKENLTCLVVCVAGWIPTHAVIKVTDEFSNTPILLWGLCGWNEAGKIITPAGQAGTTAIRPAFEALGYRFKFVYSIINKPSPMDKINAFLKASKAAVKLRSARVGTMGYRDMLLYGTQFEGTSLRRQIGVEVEPFEMLEMVQTMETLDSESVNDSVEWVKNNWTFIKPCEDEVIRKAVSYALALGEKIKSRGYEAITLIDVDGMKKLLSYPPAMVFMLLHKLYGIETIPENDVLGNVTQLMLKYITGTTIPYLEYYEFFENSVLAGVPDFVPCSVVDGEVRLLPAAFGQLASAPMNVSSVKTGYVTCVRLVYINGTYKLHMYTGEAKKPPLWEEFGWEPPAPQLPSLEIVPDSCTVEEFSQKVSSQHVLVAYGDHTETIKDLCSLLDIEIF